MDKIAEKKRAMELGESDGEAAAVALFEQGGTAALSATLVDGAETWMADAEAADRAGEYKIHHSLQYAYYECFARGARRTALAIVYGEGDGENASNYGERLKTFAGCRQSVIQAYADAYARGARRAYAEEKPAAQTVSLSVPSITVNPKLKGA